LRIYQKNTFKGGFMKKEYGYGEKYFEGKRRYYSVRKMGLRIKVIRVKKSIYEMLKMDKLYIQMNWAVNEYFNVTHLEQIRRQKCMDVEKMNGPAQSGVEVVVKVGMWERIKKFFKKIFKGGIEMKNQKGFSLIELMLVVVILGSIAFLAIGAWTDRTLEFWLSFFKGEAVSVPFILSGILSVVLNVIAVVINIISEIARIFIA